MFLSAFGTTWLLTGLVVAFPSNYLLFVMVIVFGTFLLVVARNVARSFESSEELTHSERSAKIHRRFRQINVVQWTAIGTVSGLLALLGRPTLIVPAIVGIVGIHFFPLGSLFNIKVYWIVGATMIAVACASLMIQSCIPAPAFAAIGAGLVLLGAALYAVLSTAWAKEGFLI
jgi:hypothetical protein